MKILTIIGILFCGLFIMGCTPVIPYDDCKTGMDEFDTYTEQGCEAVLAEGDYPAVAVVRTIKENGLYEYGSNASEQDEYWYTLKLEGERLEYEMELIIYENLSLDELPYKMDIPYGFNYSDICGGILSSGPYSGFVIDPEFEVLIPVTCQK
jgi:hypothetical protein